ncbi:MAG: YihY/virulence factor BrkB family protein [Actinomycetia bacterium]|nr:YihY/virulence factor BrkB family protein [Actinomycetes bacterium]
MAREGEASVKAETAPDPNDPRKPENPTDLKKPSIMHTIKSAVAEFNRDQATDLAASLTYYAVLSIFPAALAITSILAVIGQPDATVEAVREVLEEAGQGDVADNIEGIIASMSTATGGWITLLIGIGGALWAASNYVNGFGRAMNRIYQVDEGRPIWVLRPRNLVITLILLTIAMLCILGVVLSGGVAQSIGSVIGLGEQTVLIWNIAKWPVILGLVVLAVAILYYATPNVQQPKFRWISVGALIAIIVIILASAGFFFYVANFGNYDATYGALAGVIIGLLWLWIVNSVLLFGAEVDAEMERARQLQAGIKAEETIQLPPRDTRQSEKAAEALEERIEAGRELRLQARAAGATGHLAAAAGADSGPDSNKNSGSGKDTGEDGEKVAASGGNGGSAATAGGVEDSAETRLAEAVLEPLPSQEARTSGHADTGAQDSERRASSGRDWKEEALERDARAAAAKQDRDKVAARAADDDDARDDDNDADGPRDTARGATAAEHVDPGQLEPLPSEEARRLGD